MRDLMRDRQRRPLLHKAWRLGLLPGMVLLLALAALPVSGAPIVGVPSLASAATAGAPQAAHTVPRSYASDFPSAQSATSSTSEDWSGYATTGATYTSVSGSWIQPQVTCAAGENSYSAFWLGLDGDTTRTVEQTGTESDCADGAPDYSAWYEMYPAAPVTIDRPVAAGDRMSASVTADGIGGFSLTLSDTTQGWSVTTPATATRALLGSAEWIAETPSNGRRPLPLANFGTVTFSECAANGSALADNPNLDAISLATRGGAVQALPSTIATSGTSFSVTAQPASTPGSGGGSSGTPGAPSPTQPYPGHHHHWWQQGGSGQGSSSSGSGSGSGGSSPSGVGVGTYGQWPGDTAPSIGGGSAPDTGDEWPVTQWLAI
jgi:hypothetical protein